MGLPVSLLFYISSPRGHIIELTGDHIVSYHWTGPQLFRITSTLEQPSFTLDTSGFMWLMTVPNIMSFFDITFKAHGHKSMNKKRSAVLLSNLSNECWCCVTPFLLTSPHTDYMVDRFVSTSVRIGSYATGEQTKRKGEGWETEDGNRRKWEMKKPKIGMKWSKFVKKGKKNVKSGISAFNQVSPPICIE